MPRLSFTNPRSNVNPSSFPRCIGLRGNGHQVQKRKKAMAEPIDDLITELNAFEPSDDAADNDERLQIWVDRWSETPDKDNAIGAMFGLFERNPETTLLGDHGEPGPILHAIEQIPGYEQGLTDSLERVPSYYGVCMVKRIL